jgi:hypothetical protein
MFCEIPPSEFWRSNYEAPERSVGRTPEDTLHYLRCRLFGILLFVCSRLREEDQNRQIMTRLHSRASVMGPQSAWRR